MYAVPQTLVMAMRQSAIPDEFVALPGGGFLVTMMGSATGGSPGRVAKINPDLTVQGMCPSRKMGETSAYQMTNMPLPAV